jgi:hypothetical protein
MPSGNLYWTTNFCMRTSMAWWLSVGMALRGEYTPGFLLILLTTPRSMFFLLLFFYIYTHAPNRVLLYPMRDKGLCPCPQCLMAKTKVHLMGQSRNLAFRLANPRTILRDAVQTARCFIYRLAFSIGGTAVEGVLKATSSVPTFVSYYCLF